MTLQPTQLSDLFIPNIGSRLWAYKYTRQSTYDTNISYTDACTIVTDIFYIGSTAISADAIHYLEPQNNRP